VDKVCLCGEDGFCVFVVKEETEMAHPNPRLLIPVALIAVLGVGGWYVEAQRARTQSTLSGFFETQPTELASRIGGRVESILVAEGDTVHAGQTLVGFETAANQAETRAKLATAEQARQQLRQVRNGPRTEDIRRQEGVVAEAQAALARLKNGARPEEVGAARARLQQVEALYRKSRAGARPEEIAQARAAERNARAKLAQAERGPTPEERAQARARLEAAAVQEGLARDDLARNESLFREGAISRQQFERAQTDQRAAEARRKELEEALRQAEIGTPKEEMDQAREAYRQAQAALALVLAGSRREDIAAAKAEVDAAQQNLQLLRKGSRREDIEAAQARLDQAQAALQALRKGSRPEEIAQAEAAARAAAASAQSAQDNLHERVIRAPIEGVVERILIAVGDLVTPGMPVARMTDPKDLWIRVYVPEANLANLRVGSDAVLQVDGIAEAVPAQVESIAARGEFTPANLQTPDERGKQVFAVRLRLKRPDPRIKAGMAATVVRLGQWP
jgi:HlyD family secretion protein